MTKPYKKYKSLIFSIIKITLLKKEWTKYRGVNRTLLDFFRHFGGFPALILKGCEADSPKTVRTPKSNKLQAKHIALCQKERNLVINPLPNFTLYQFRAFLTIKSLSFSSYWYQKALSLQSINTVFDLWTQNTFSLRAVLFPR